MNRTGRTQRLGCLVTVLACLSFGGVKAQSSGQTGIHFGMLHFDKILEDDGFPPIAITLGVEHDLGEYLAFGVDATWLWRNLVNSTISSSRSAEQSTLRYAGWVADYTEDKRSWSVIYRSAFFPGGRGSQLYLGSFIGVRSITRTLVVSATPDYTGQSAPDDPFRRKYEAKRMVFPAGLRMGWRSEMDGFYSDFYFGIGYQFGGGKNLFDEPEMTEAPTTLAGMTWTLGYTYGIGW